MKRLLYTTAALIGFAGAIAYSQSVVTQALNGAEAIIFGAGGPGGPSGFVNSAVLREGQDFATIGAGTTITQTISPNTGQVIVTGAITTLNLSLPAAPYNGQTVRVACPGGTVSTLTLSAPFGGTTNQSQGPLNPATVITGLNPTACTTTVQVSASMLYTYQATPSIWFRVGE